MYAAQFDDLCPEELGHIGIAPIALKAGIDEHDNIRPFVDCAAAMPGELGRLADQPFAEIRVSEECGNIEHKAVAARRLGGVVGAALILRAHAARPFAPLAS